MHKTSSITGVIHVNGIHNELELIHLYQSLLVEPVKFKDGINMTFLYSDTIDQDSPSSQTVRAITSIVWSGAGPFTCVEYVKYISAYLQQLYLLTDIDSASFLVTDILSKASVQLAFCNGLLTSTETFVPTNEEQLKRLRSRLPASSKITHLSKASKSRLTKEIEARNKRILDYIKSRRGY